MKFTWYRGWAVSGALALMGLGMSGCGGSSSASGTTDTIVATWSVTGTATVVVGGSKSFTLSFNSSDAKQITNLTVTSGLSSMPAGWSGPSSFSCSQVSTGSGCLLTLTYAPTASANGTLTISYSYVNDAGSAANGTATIPYATTTDDSVDATVAPTGQINTTVGASQAVNVSFVTDDGKQATALTLTSSLSSLPAGWSSTASSFSCATISTGSGCLLPLSYAPTAAASGSVTLNYSYTDNAGNAKTGTLSIPYQSTASTPAGNDIVATASPTGQIAGITGGSQVVTVTFTTDDQNTATALSLTTNLSGLPSGWSAAGSSFSCASVSTGSGCQLSLTYAPSAVATGTLSLAFAYTDSAGTAKTGTLNIGYTATANNNVVGTAAPTGQINAIIGAGSQAVTVTFTTDSGTATALSLITALNSLPSGWSSTATGLTCATVTSSGNSCQLPLSYAPGAVGNGTLTLNYGYTDNAGVGATGTVSIQYAATANDNVGGAVSPSGTISTAVGSSQAVTVTFTTDDSNIATSLAIANAGTGGLGSLPSGWTVAGGASSFACSSVSTGTTCQLGLTYAPSAATGATALSLDYTYINNAGINSSGTVSIPYAATVQQHAYVVDYSTGVWVCTLDSSGALSACASTGSGFNQPISIAFSSDGTTAYVGNFYNSISICAVTAGTGALTCSSSIQSGPTSSVYLVPSELTVDGSYLYVYNANTYNTTSSCQIVSGDSLSACVDANSSFDGANYAGFTVGGGYAYIDRLNGIWQCSVVGDGTINSCAGPSTLSNVSNYGALSIFGGYLFNIDANGVVDSCAIGNNGAVSTCTSSTLASASFPEYASVGGIAVQGSNAYAVEQWSNSNTNSSAGTGVYLCSVSAGVVSGCTLQNPTGANFTQPEAIVIE